MVSIRMGERNFAEARKVLANCFLMLCVFSVLLVGGILPFQEPMLRLFGASDATIPMLSGILRPTCAVPFLHWLPRA